MKTSVVVFSLFALTVCLVFAPQVTAQDSGYGITIDGSLDVPDRNVSYSGDTFEITSVGKISLGEKITVHTTSSASEYDVFLYNSEEEIADSRSFLSGNNTLTFDTAGYTPGSYAVVISESGVYKKIHPIVLPGYDVSIDVSREKGDPEMTAEVELTETELDGAPNRVVVAYGNEQTQRTVEATRTDEGKYTATASLAGVPHGEYAVYGIAQTNKTVFRSREIVGISQPTTIEVETSMESEADETTNTKRNRRGSSDEDTSGNNESDGGVLQPDLSASDDGDGSPLSVETVAVAVVLIVITSAVAMRKLNS